MTDIQIDNDSDGFDLSLVDGDLVLLSDWAQVVRQRVIYRLQTWLGESPYDTEAGLPYLDLIFADEPLPGIVSIVTQEILAVDGVSGLIEPPTFTEPDADRILTIGFIIQVDTEEVPINLEVAA